MCIVLGRRGKREEEMCANAFVDFSTAVASAVFRRNKKNRSDDLSRPESTRRIERGLTQKKKKKRGGGATDPIFSSQRQRTQPHYITRTPPSFPLASSLSKSKVGTQKKKKKKVDLPTENAPATIIQQYTHTKEKPSCVS